jgi:hypothetical protein
MELASIETAEEQAAIHAAIGKFCCDINVTRNLVVLFHAPTIRQNKM